MLSIISHEKDEKQNGIQHCIRDTIRVELIVTGRVIIK